MTSSTALRASGDVATDALLFGAKFDETLCDGWDENFYHNAPCLASASGWASGKPSILNTASLATSNASSTPFKTVTLAAQNDTAILVPQNITDANMTDFTATTYAVRAVCFPLNQYCPDAVEIGQLDRRKNCSSLGYPGIPNYDSSKLGNGTIFGMVDGAMSGVG